MVAIDRERIEKIERKGENAGDGQVLFFSSVFFSLLSLGGPMKKQVSVVVRDNKICQIWLIVMIVNCFILI